MGKSAYIGVGGVAKKIKNMYIGVGGVARKVKKAWIGVGGVARLFFSSGNVEKSTKTMSNLYYSKGASAISNGTYIFFDQTSYDDDEDRTAVGLTVYNKSLTKKTVTAPYHNDDRHSYSMGQNSTYVVMNGGRRSATMTYFDSMDCYDLSLTKTRITDLTTSYYKQSGHVSGTISDNILFAGGGSGVSSVFGFSPTLTKLSGIPSLSSTRTYGTESCNIGNYLLFAGGLDGNLRTDVNAYDASFTKINATAFPSGMQAIATGRCGNDSYAIFHYGTSSTSSANCLIYAYNTSLTLTTTATKPSYTPYHAAMAKTPEYGVLCGGYGSSSDNGRNRVEAWDTSLTKSSLTALTTARKNAGAAVIGDYLLVGGGQTGSHTNSKDETIYDYTNNVEVYTIS